MMTRTVNPCGRRAAAKVKIRMSRIAMRPATGRWFECPNFCGSCQARIGEGLFRCRCRLKFRCRCRFDEERSRRPGFAAAVYPGGGDSNGSLLDLVSRHRLRGHEVEQNGGAARDAATAMPPAPDGPWADAEPPSGAALCDVKRVKYLAEPGRGRG